MEIADVQRRLGGKKEELREFVRYQVQELLANGCKLDEVSGFYVMSRKFLFCFFMFTGSLSSSFKYYYISRLVHPFFGYFFYIYDFQITKQIGIVKKF